MKSLANSLLHIADGVCEDVRLAYPDYRGIFLDKERIALYSQTRGIGFFTLDLPSLDSVLVQGLADGFLTLKGPLTRAVSKRVRVPRLFSGLWLKVFDSTGVLRPDVDVNSILFLRQITCLWKKLEHDCTDDRIKATIEAYHDIELEIVPPTLDWVGDVLDPHNSLRSVHLCDSLGTDLPLFPNTGQDSEYRGILTRCQQVADLVCSSFKFFEPVSYSETVIADKKAGLRHGPGAVADRSGIVHKYEFPRWSAKLEEWFPYRECGTIASDMESKPLNHEVASRLLSVPKTAKAPRLIASEPTEHQWCQQLTKYFIVEQLKNLFGSSFVSFDNQKLSGDMALRASRDGSMATIDLSSASDRLSCHTVERLLRKSPSLLHALHASRTRYIRDDISGEKPIFVKLKKFASQGTAVTFPIQTLCFLIIAIGCNIQGEVNWRNIRKLRNTVRVFGDDIIIPNTGYADTAKVLTHLGLKVNMEKSFHTGLFRESCGVDAFMGFDITPCKLTRAVPDGPSSRQAIIDESNNLFKKGFWIAAERLESTMGRSLRQLPITALDDSIVGLSSFCGRKLDHLKSRWNKLLHRNEWRVLSNRVTLPKIRPGGIPALLQLFTVAEPSFLPREHGYTGRPKLRDKLRWDPLY